jgi:hypothetical protein
VRGGAITAVIGSGCVAKVAHGATYSPMGLCFNLKMIARPLKTLTLRLPPELIERIDQTARRENRSRNGQVIDLVSRALVQQAATRNSNGTEQHA